MARSRLKVGESLLMPKNCSVPAVKKLPLVGLRGLLKLL